jgi:hypothetical protein
MYNTNSNSINDKLCTYSTNSNDNKNKNNHNFKSVSQCSLRNLNINSSTPNKYEINKNTDRTRRYKYNIRIHNINVNRGMNRSASYENLRRRRKYIKNIDSMEEYEQKYYLDNNNRSSYDYNLKMQNAQNMQVIQNEKLLQILVPLPENQIDYACNMEIRSNNNKKKYKTKEIKETKITNNVQTTEIIEENRYKNKKILKKPNWNLTNRTIKENKISYENDKIKIEKIYDKKKPEQKKELDMENFEINISDNGRRFRGEMLIENNSVKYEKQKKDPNLNLLLSPNQSILLKADHPRRDWNSITRTASQRSLSIDGKNKQVLL